MLFLSMKKIAFIIIIVCSALTAHAQLLYSISGKGNGQKSYILGTYHFAPPSFCDSIPGLWKALDEVKQVCGELVMADMANTENLTKFQSAMMLPEGVTLQSLMTEEEMGRLNTLCKEIMGTDFTNPLIANQLGKFTPGALYEQLIVMLYMSKTPNFNPNDAIDNYMQSKALEKGYEVTGFETIDEQINILFKSQTLERQKTLLMCFVDNRDFMMQQTDDLTAAYFRQDLESIKTITDEKFNDACDSTEEEEELLISGRNANWAQKMPEMMSAKNTLFVVGAAHLVGEKGVLQLMRDAGYVVEPVTR